MSKRASTAFLASVESDESHWRRYYEHREIRAREKIRLEYTRGVDTCTIPKEMVLPSVTERKLLPHQLYGVQWLHRALSFPNAVNSGAVLADEMGLGKTIQCAVYVGSALLHNYHQNCLIVAPTTLISNWIQELVEWTPFKEDVDIIALRPSACKARSALRVVKPVNVDEEDNKENVPGLQLKGIYVTTYGIVQSDVEAWQQAGVKFDLVILDEGHQVKNRITLCSQACRRIPSKKRLVVTGTPVMNDLMELHSIFGFVDPIILGKSSMFARNISSVIRKGQMRDSSESQVQGAKAALEELTETLAPYCLRRTKSSVEQETGTPLINGTKTEMILWAKMSDIQQEMYAKALKNPELLEAMKKSKSEFRRCAFTHLFRLKNLCDHSWLNFDGEMFEKQIKEATDNQIIENSGKLGVLVSLLEHHLLRQRGDRVLIFSRSKRILDVIERVIKPMTKHYRIDGSTPVPERHVLVKKFNNPRSAVRVCLLTTQVGGLGLTLTGANVVVIMDPSWNPAIDSQAVDRAHRIGQQRNVMVYRMITCGTVEEKMYQRQIFKSNLLSPADQSRSKNPFTAGQMRDLFVLGEMKKSATHEQLIQLIGPDVGKSEADTFDCEATNHTAVLAAPWMNSAHPDTVVHRTLYEDASLSESDELPRAKRRKQYTRHERDASRTQLTQESSRDWSDFFANWVRNYISSMDLAELAEVTVPSVESKLIQTFAITREFIRENVPQLAEWIFEMVAVTRERKAFHQTPRLLTAEDLNTHEQKEFLYLGHFDHLLAARTQQPQESNQNWSDWVRNYISSMDLAELSQVTVSSVINKAIRNFPQKVEFIHENIPLITEWVQVQMERQAFLLSGEVLALDDRQKGFSGSYCDPICPNPDSEYEGCDAKGEFVEIEDDHKAYFPDEEEQSKYDPCKGEGDCDYEVVYGDDAFFKHSWDQNGKSEEFLSAESRNSLEASGESSYPGTEPKQEVSEEQEEINPKKRLREVEFIIID
eukprot:PhF_6_TR27913/c0_g1_i1/m.40997/K20093/ERCC6L, PICH; DNA excision repair protein ERCC-6-like